MKHRKGFNRLARKPAHRLSLYRHMAAALFRHERVRTTVAKAKAMRRVVERMISRARTDTVANRRLLARHIQERAILAKLFTDIAPRFAGRPGGYTRVVKIGKRAGDASEMAILELVIRKETKKKAKKAEGKGSSSKADETARAEKTDTAEKVEAEKAGTGKTETEKA